MRGESTPLQCAANFFSTLRLNARKIARIRDHDAIMGQACKRLQKAPKAQSQNLLEELNVEDDRAYSRPHPMSHTGMLQWFGTQSY